MQLFENSPEGLDSQNFFILVPVKYFDRPRYSKIVMQDISFTTLLV